MMIHFCKDRPEGFSLNSKFSSLPTSCFFDSIIVPIPVWVALIAFPVLCITTNKSLRKSPLRLHQLQLSTRYRVLQSLYLLLVVAQVLMITLEIVRLSILEFGIGLLPFVYVGLLLAGLLHISDGFHGAVRGWIGLNFILWLGGAAVGILQVLELSYEPLGLEARKDSKYPVSDQVIDVAVMVGVYAVLACLELGLAMWRKKIDSEVMGRVNQKGVVVESMASMEYPGVEFR